MLVSGQHKPPLATLCIQPRPPLPAPRFWRAGIVISFLSCGWLSPLLDLSLDSTSSSRIIQFSDSRSVSLTPWLPQNFISPLRTDCWGRGTIRLYVLDVNNSLYFLYHLCLKLWFFFKRFCCCYCCGWFLKSLLNCYNTLLFAVLVFWPGGVWGLSSPTRDGTCACCVGGWSLNHWPPGKSFKLWLLRLWAGETFSLSLFLLFLEAYSTVDACALGACVHVCVSLRPHGL